MDVQETIQVLIQAGTEQNRKVYSRHGVGDPFYGVSFADLDKLHKKIKVDHALARQLWASGIHDARVLATRIADPHQVDEALIIEWTGGLQNYIVSDDFARLVARTCSAHSWMERWVVAEDEWVGRAGWTLVALTALYDKNLPDSAFGSYLSQIETEIHGRKNRTREAMNNALIAIGSRSAALEQQALDVARRIGKVDIDHGDTHCKTPDAVQYIPKARNHKQKKEKRS